MKTSFVLLILSILALSATKLQAQEKQASKIVADYFKWLDAGNIDAVGQLLADDFKATAPFSPMPFDKNAWRGVGQNFNAAFPDMKHEVVRWFADDNSVAVEGIFSGTNSGPHMGNPPTGNRAVEPFTTIFMLNGKGKIKSLNIRFDQKSFEKQLLAGIDPAARAEANIRLAYSSLEKRDFKTFMGLCDPKFVELGLSPDPIRGVENAVEAYKPFLSAFPDLKFDIVSIVPAGGGKYFVTTRPSGTNLGAFMGIPATGKRVDLAEDVDIVMLNEHGLCVSHKGLNPNAMLDAIGITHLLDPMNMAAESTVRGIMAAADAGDVDKLASFFAPEAKHYFGGQLNTGDELKKRVAGFKTGFPDIRRDLQVISVSKGTITVQGCLTGTNTGMFMGKPATGNKIKVSVLGVYKTNEAGKVTEAWVELDSASLMAQLKGEDAAMGKPAKN